MKKIYWLDKTHGDLYRVTRWTPEQDNMVPGCRAADVTKEIAVYDHMNLLSVIDLPETFFELDLSRKHRVNYWLVDKMMGNKIKKLGSIVTDDPKRDIELFRDQQAEFEKGVFWKTNIIFEFANK